MSGRVDERASLLFFFVVVNVMKSDTVFVVTSLELKTTSLGTAWTVGRSDIFFRRPRGITICHDILRWITIYHDISRYITINPEIAQICAYRSSIGGHRDLHEFAQICANLRKYRDISYDIGAEMRQLCIEGVYFL